MRVLTGLGSLFLFFEKGGESMTNQEEERYEDPQALRQIIQNLKGRKFRLDCGHHVTFGHHLGNHIVVLNGKEPQIICSLCSY
jgi:hypothetical protein